MAGFVELHCFDPGPDMLADKPGHSLALQAPANIRGPNPEQPNSERSAEPEPVSDSESHILSPDSAYSLDPAPLTPAEHTPDQGIELQFGAPPLLTSAARLKELVEITMHELCWVGGK